MGKALAVIENSKTLTRHSYYASDYDWIYETMMGLPETTMRFLLKLLVGVRMLLLEIFSSLERVRLS